LRDFATEFLEDMLKSKRNGRWDSRRFGCVKEREEEEDAKPKLGIRV
jgi:hypothetical protein